MFYKPPLSEVDDKHKMKICFEGRWEMVSKWGFHPMTNIGWCVLEKANSSTLDLHLGIYLWKLRWAQ